MLNERKIAIVVPTIRENNLIGFLNSWNFSNVSLYIIEDNPKKSFNLPLVQSSVKLFHYSWQEIDTILGDKAWIIPRRTDCIRSFGFFKAYMDGCDYVITLDDDCLPLQPAHEFIDEHITCLNTTYKRWKWTTKEIKSRGVPYFNLGSIETVISMGFWQGVTDLDAPSQLVYGVRDLEPEILSPVPSGSYYPMCGMNLAFKVKFVPVMYFLLMGKEYQVDRFGDIWCGIITKKIFDHLGLAVTTGKPAVKHIRASNVWSNLKKEQGGLELNENFWEQVDKIQFTNSAVDIFSCYREIIEGLKKADLLLEYSDYLEKLVNAMDIWLNLY